MASSWQQEDFFFESTECTSSSKFPVSQQPNSAYKTELYVYVWHHTCTHAFRSWMFIQQSLKEPWKFDSRITVRMVLSESTTKLSKLTTELSQLDLDQQTESTTEQWTQLNWVSQQLHLVRELVTNHQTVHLCLACIRTCKGNMSLGCLFQYCGWIRPSYWASNEALFGWIKNVT